MITNVKCAINFRAGYNYEHIHQLAEFIAGANVVNAISSHRSIKLSSGILLRRNQKNMHTIYEYIRINPACQTLSKEYKFRFNDMNTAL